ncbi:H family protein [Megaselia abdita]
MDENSSIEHIGGKLQFFKDGKFILELTGSKEGESFNWISAPRKIVKSASTITAATKHDGSSCSDDNSSLQSSPWQRDHYWKQSNPKKEISKELCLYFCKQKQYGKATTINNKNVLKFISRRPFITEIERVISTKNQLNNAVTKMRYQPAYKFNSNLSNVIERLTFIAEKKMHSLLGKQNHITVKLIDAYNHTHISPRKRILREFEKVSLDDNKRSKSKYSAYGNKLEGTINNKNISKLNDEFFSDKKVENTHSRFYTTMATQLSKTFTSYSINSLLANKTEHNVSSSELSMKFKQISNASTSKNLKSNIKNNSKSANQICESGFHANTSTTSKLYCQSTLSDSLKKDDTKLNDSTNNDFKSNNINDCAFGENSITNICDLSEKTVSLRHNFEYANALQKSQANVSITNNINENSSAIRNLPMVTSTNSSMFYLYPSPMSSSTSYIPTVPQTNFYHHYSNAFINLRNSSFNSNPWLSYPAAIVAAAGILPYFPYNEITAAGLAGQNQQTLQLREELKNGEHFDKTTNANEENDVPLNLSKH